MPISGLKELGVKLAPPPEPFGTYLEAVQKGNLLFLTGTLQTKGRAAKFIGRVGAGLDVEDPDHNPMIPRTIITSLKPDGETNSVRRCLRLATTKVVQKKNEGGRK
jgi:hypothetical protein